MYFQGISGLYKPALMAWLWSLHLDAPSAFSAVNFGVSALLIGVVTGPAWRASLAAEAKRS